MESPTPRYLAVFLLFICSGTQIHAEFSDSVPDCSVDWQADWNDVPENFGMESFQNPGENTEGITVPDMMQFLGLAWNAPSWQEIIGLACVRYGPVLNEVAGDDRVRRECEDILRSLRAGKRTSIYDSCTRVLKETGASDHSTSSLDLYQTGDPDLDGLETVENLSPIVFELLEWLGPSPFSFDLHGACSALRIMLSMPVEDIIDRLKNICVYPMAVFLESLSDHEVCRPENLVPGTEKAYQVDVLDVLSAPRGPICRFFSSNPDHEEFVDRARVIVDNAVAFLTNTDICEGILVALADFLVEAMDFEFITGYNLFSASDREALCKKISDAFDPSSSFVPAPYVLPEGTSLEDFRFDEVPGEILPGYSFDDCLDVAGAFRRAGTLVEGTEVLCDVFERVLIDASSPGAALDIAQMCRLLSAKDLAGVEDTCLDLVYQPERTYNGITVPLSVRALTPFYMGAIGVEYYRQLFQPTRISEEDSCRALDRFFNSENNLQSVTRLAVDVWLAELIPMAHRVCEDYRAFSAYFEARARRYGTDYTPLEEGFTDIILAHLGFASRRELCGVIADGIIPKSGRATDEVVERFQQELLAFLTNQSRCEASADAFLKLLEDEADVSRDDVPLYTGYNSTSAACEDLESFFTTQLCDTPGDPQEPCLSDDCATVPPIQPTDDGSTLRCHPSLLIAILVQATMVIVNIY